MMDSKRTLALAAFTEATKADPHCGCEVKTIGASLYGLWWTMPCDDHKHLHWMLKRLEVLSDGAAFEDQQ